MGETAEFFCEVNKNVTWTQNDESLPDNIKLGKFNSNEHYLRIRNIQIWNAGIYTCFGLLDELIVKAIGKIDVFGKFYPTFWFSQTSTIIIMMPNLILKCLYAMMLCLLSMGISNVL